MKDKRIIGLTGVFLFISLLLMAMPLAITPAPTDDYATGSFTLNAQPTVSNVNFEVDAYGSDEALDPVTVWQRLNFTVSHLGTFDDIANCTIWIYDDSTHGANYNTSAEDGIFLVQYLWVEDTDTWSVSDQGAMTEWDVDDGANSIDPGTASSQTDYEFSMRFNISQVARADTTDWNATVHVYDDDGEWDYASESSLVTMNNYFSITYSTRTFTWGAAVQPNSDNNTHGALTMTAYANAAWEIRINATDFNSSGESDVDVEANDILTWDQDGSNDDMSQFIRNTIATMPVGSTWDAQSAMTDEDGIDRNVYYFLSPGALFVVSKEWNTTVTLWIQADS